MKIVSLYTAASGTTNAAITYQWINRARLDTIFFSIYALAGAGALDVAHEFSLQSTNQIGTNDPVGVIATVRTTSLTISNGYLNNGLITPIGFQFNAADRLYVAPLIDGTCNGNILT